MRTPEDRTAACHWLPTQAGLAKLLARSGDAVQLNPYFEGDIGAVMFEHTCKLGLEGVVSSTGIAPIGPAGDCPG